MQQLKDESDLKLEGFTVIKFSATWCAPCKQLNPIMKKMEAEFPVVNFVSVDIDDFIKLAQKYQIKSVPTLLFLEGEIEKNKLVGVFPTEQVRKAFKAFTTKAQ